MRQLPEDEDYGGEDFDVCPHCQAELGEFSGDVSDDDIRPDGNAIAGADCPSCGGRIAIVRMHSYRLTRFRESFEAT